MNFGLKKIDLYLLKKFLKTFFFSCLLFSLVALVIEISQKLENLMQTGQPWEDVVVEYLLTFIPWINGLLWPLFALLSVVFFTSRLARDTEFIAMLGAGISLKRLLVPYLLAAVFIMTLHFVSNHYLIPVSNDIRLNFEYTHIRPDKVEGRNQDVHFFLTPEQKIYIRFYSRMDTTCRDVRIESFSEEGELVQILKGRTMRLVEKPNKWRINDYEVRSLGKEDRGYEMYHGNHMDTVLNLFPEDFITYGKSRDMMTSPQLLAFMERERSKGVGESSAMMAEYYRRTADPFSILILTLIGFSIASRKVRGGMGIHLALGVVLGAVFVFASKFSITFALGPATNTFLAIWLPNIFFGAIALLLFFKAQR